MYKCDLHFHLKQRVQLRRWKRIPLRLKAPLNFIVWFELKYTYINFVGNVLPTFCYLRMQTNQLPDTMKCKGALSVFDATHLMVKCGHRMRHRFCLNAAAENALYHPGFIIVIFIWRKTHRISMCCTVNASFYKTATSTTRKSVVLVAAQRVACLLSIKFSSRRNVYDKVPVL